MVISCTRFYCCCNKLPKVSRLKTTPTYYFTVSIGEKSGTVWLSWFPASSHKAKIKVSAKQHSFLEGLGKNALPSSFRSLQIEYQGQLLVFGGVRSQFAEVSCISLLSIPFIFKLVMVNQVLTLQTSLTLLISLLPSSAMVFV